MLCFFSLLNLTRAISTYIAMFISALLELLVLPTFQFYWDY